MKNQFPRRQLCATLSLTALFLGGALAQAQNSAAPQTALERNFLSPPDAARPWVYWYFMDGHVTREGLRADLEAMQKAGIGGAIYLEVGIGVPRGPVKFMSQEWQELFAYAVSEAKRLGIEIALGTGPGWAGSGGPWVKPELSMQHLVASQTSVRGPVAFDAVLPRPNPRTPFFGEGTLTPELRAQWLGFYADEAVLAFPTPLAGAQIADTDGKALYYRAPYSSKSGTPPRLDAPADFPAVPANQTVSTAKTVVLTPKMGADGRLKWQVPPGDWTILRLGRTATGQTTRPAPAPAIGFESDKFSIAALDAHLQNYTQPLFEKLGANFGNGAGGLTMLHFDSWEMGSQNWSPDFKREFIQRRGYDPTPLLPAMLGFVVDSAARSERFLWDLRQTASELVIENHAGALAKYARAKGLRFAVEPYDMNPASDLDLGAVADVPMGEFWSQGFGFKTEYSVLEAVSIAHTNGRKIVGAESFTADDKDVWLQHPGSMKAQLDWALAAGINKFAIHRYQHQPDVNRFPGMAMGPYGVHWERTQTWWDMVPAFHKYITRTSEILRQGLPVADILYLTPEGAPQVFTAPASALTGGLPDRKGHNFDGCSPRTLMARASVKDGQIVFPDGMSYRVLVLPQWETMTPQLLQKIVQLVENGAVVVGKPPQKSPSLSGFPHSDAQVRALAARLWGNAPFAPSRRVGRGRIIFDATLPAPAAPASPLRNARWIWFPEGKPAQLAPVGTRYFRANLEIDGRRSIASALATLTADNSFELLVNNQSAGSGNNFNNPTEIDIAAWLRPGANEIRVIAQNGGEAPNPAGLLGAIQIVFKDGTRQSLTTGAAWSVSTSADGPTSAALELGASGMAPWKLGLNAAQPASIYPEYETTAKLLGEMGVAPDFSSGAPLRYIHRRFSNGDVYFVANASAQPIETTCTFRASGRQPQWWNPLSGERRDLPQHTQNRGLTTIPVRLAPYESGFVVFHKPVPKRALSGTNFPTFQTLMTLSARWDVAFDPRWGGPEKVTFSDLEDWTQRPEAGIKYYSGKATYSSAFDLPGAFPRAGERYGLSLGTVKNIASVRLNGEDLGVVWCAPWRIEIPADVLRATGNQLEITVANLWTNRLIGDAGKPQEQRLTSTTFNALKATSALQPSGLLGPVALQIVAD